MNEELTEKQVFDVISGGRIIHGAHIISNAGGGICCYVDGTQFYKALVEFPQELQRPFGSRYTADVVIFDGVPLIYKETIHPHKEESTINNILGVQSEVNDGAGGWLDRFCDSIQGGWQPAQES